MIDCPECAREGACRAQRALQGGGSMRPAPHLQGSEMASAGWACECRDCGAVFESAREDSACPECGSEDVMGMNGWEKRGI